MPSFFLIIYTLKNILSFSKTKEWTTNLSLFIPKIYISKKSNTIMIFYLLVVYLEVIVLFIKAL